MSISMVALSYMVLYAFFLGVFFGILYDAFCIVRILFGIKCTSGSGKGAEYLYSLKYPLIGKIQRKENKIKDGAQKVLMFFTDFSFCVFVGVAFCIFLYYANSGIFRWTAAVAAIVGFFCYHISIGRLVISVSETVDAIFKIFIKICIFAIAFPFKVVYNILISAYKATFGKFFCAIAQILAKKQTKKQMDALIKSVISDFSELPKGDDKNAE